MSGELPPVLEKLLLALEAALNSVLHTLPLAPYPAMASLLEDPLLLQAYHRLSPPPPPPQLSSRVQSYIRRPRSHAPHRDVASQE